MTADELDPHTSFKIALKSSTYKGEKLHCIPKENLLTIKELPHTPSPSHVRTSLHTGFCQLSEHNDPSSDITKTRPLYH